MEPKIIEFQHGNWSSEKDTKQANDNPIANYQDRSHPHHRSSINCNVALDNENNENKNNNCNNSISVQLENQNKVVMSKTGSKEIRVIESYKNSKIEHNDINTVRRRIQMRKTIKPRRSSNGEAINLIIEKERTTDYSKPISDINTNLSIKMRPKEKPKKSRSSNRISK